MTIKLRDDVLVAPPPPVIYRRGRGLGFDYTELREFTKDEIEEIEASKPSDSNQDRPIYRWVLFLKLRKIQLGTTCRSGEGLKRFRDDRDPDASPVSFKQAKLSAF